VFRWNGTLGWNLSLKPEGPGVIRNAFRINGPDLPTELL
jgi:hypothetical protein